MENEKDCWIKKHFCDTPEEQKWQTIELPELDADDFPHPPMPPWLQHTPENPPIDLPDEYILDMEAYAAEYERQRENRTIALIGGILCIVPFIFIIVYFLTGGSR